MSIELTHKIVKCRKEHRCDWCGETINTGDHAHYRTGIFEDSFYSGHQHPECYDAMMRSDFGWDEGYSPMDQVRGKTLDESFE